jgi:alkanesulfonate monooxygenase SsuD/methylene tetrahydromethanopterin reductase-like flavin-dependent oxidoreductase (luciferase family)
LAARTADVIFTAQHTLNESRAFYADVKGRAMRYGRSPDDVKIMPGVSPIVGRNEAEAREKLEELESLIHPAVGLAILEASLGGVDLSSFPLDGLLPDLPTMNASRSRQQLVIDLAHREKLTIRQLYRRVAGAIGHWQVVGTPERIADELEERFLNEGADGFNVMAPTFPGGFNDFVELVVPELQRRGLFRREYEGRTLRENLGLSCPGRSLHPARA